MKKIISLIFAVLMLVSLFAFTGCKRVKKSDFIGEYECIVAQNRHNEEEMDGLTLKINKDHTLEWSFYSTSNEPGIKTYEGEWKEYTVNKDVMLYCYYSVEESDGITYSHLFTLKMLDDETLVFQSLSNESSAVRYYEKVD
ncbi:MAG: hypothetical protein IJZ93_04215 [Clostridia bacterium]|nr:hypothetical protein [Clostridia bacterium]